MDQQVTVRLPEALHRALSDASRRMNRKRSEIVRLALMHYLHVADDGATAAQRVSDLLGSLDSGVPDLATRHREYVLESIRRGA